jgi:hypothetical protein
MLLPDCHRKFPVFLLIWAFGAVWGPFSAAAQTVGFDVGNIFFSVSPKILQHGSITDVGAGYRYTEHYSSRLHFRFSNEDKNDEFDIDGVSDSLNVINEKNFEVFLLPVEWTFVENPKMEFKTGAGIYYNYNTLAEKGYFNMPLLEELGKERVNSYKNDFSMHTFGINFEINFISRIDNVEMSGTAGIVPVFYFLSKQKMGMVPLLDPHYAEFSQRRFGSPYVYADINVILFKYFSLSCLYDFSRLEYQVIDFDDSLNWYNPSRMVFSNAIKLEASLLVPIMSAVKAKIGFGYSWNSIQLDTAKPIWNRQYYVVFDTKVNQS